MFKKQWLILISLLLTPLYVLASHNMKITFHNKTNQAAQVESITTPVSGSNFWGPDDKKNQPFEIKAKSTVSADLTYTSRGEDCNYKGDVSFNLIWKGQSCSYHAHYCEDKYGDIDYYLDSSGCSFASHQSQKRSRYATITISG